MTYQRRHADTRIGQTQGLLGLNPNFACDTQVRIAHTKKKKWVPGLSRVESGQGVALTTHPHLLPRLKKE